MAVGRRVSSLLLVAGLIGLALLFARRDWPRQGDGGTRPPMIDDVIAIAREAGALIQNHYLRSTAEELDVRHKADDSPLTRADRDANDRIVARLQALTPDVPIVAEESPLPPAAERRAWTRFWLVDPLDGTKEFLKRNGEFTVNIALIEDGEPVLGVVFAPALDVLYAATRGGGAFKITGDGERQPIHSAPPAAGAALVVVTSRSHAGADDVARALGDRTVREERHVGSSLKFCLVAEGTADVYVRGGPTNEWDVGAGDCVYRNSGRDAPRSSPLRYNKPSLKNEGFVIGLDP